MGEVNADEVLQFLAQKYKMGLNDVLEEMENMKEREILERHPYEIKLYKDGRYHTYVEDKGSKYGRRQIAKKTKGEVEREIVRHYRDARALTLRKVYPKWFKQKALETNNSGTMRRIDSEWNAYYLNDPIIDAPMDEFTKHSLKAWAMQKIIDNRLTKKQYYNMQIIIRQSLDYLVENDKLESNPFRGFVINRKLFSSPPKKEHRKEVFSVDEEKKVKKLAFDNFNRCPTYTAPLAVILTFYLGLRVGELVALKWKDYDGKYMSIRRMEQRRFRMEGDKWEHYFVVVEHTKSDAGNRTIPVVGEAAKILDLVRSANAKNGTGSGPEDFIFQHGGTRVSTASIDSYYNRYCKKLGIVKKGNHKARKTCLSKIADNPNINLRDAMEFAGHEDVKTFINHYCFSRYNDDYKIKELENALGED